MDSSVCAELAYRAIGDRLQPIYIDTGLMRKGETERIRHIFSHMNLDIVYAKDKFLAALKGITDPEEKRKAIGETFIRVFEKEARKLAAEYLIQGTIYPDRIESEGGIKSHHNVGGLPSVMDFKQIVEPIADLYKDEVREIAWALQLPDEICERMPFPGPGLAVRVLGEVTEEKLEVVREANFIVEEELLDRFCPWQTFCCYPRQRNRCKRRHQGIRMDRSCKGGGVQRWNDCRSARTSLGCAQKLEARITSEIPKVARVVYDITPKPPATIEFE